MCGPHFEQWPSVHGIPKGYLDFDLYQQIIEGLAAEGCRFDHLILQWLGDPSLHPRLEEMAGFAGRQLKNLLGYVRFDTNGILLDPQRMERLVADEPDFALAHSALAAWCTRLERHQDAVQHARRVVELEPRDPFSYTALSVACMRAGLIMEAEDALARSRMLQG